MRELIEKFKKELQEYVDSYGQKLGEAYFARIGLELIAEIEKLERDSETLRQISQLICGNDRFPGDIVPYIRNEIDGRRAEEKEIAQLRAIVDAAKDLDGSIVIYMTASSPTTSLQRILTKYIRGI